MILYFYDEDVATLYGTIKFEFNSFLKGEYFNLFFKSLLIVIWMLYVIINYLNCYWYWGVLFLRNWRIHCGGYYHILVLELQNQTRNPFYPFEYASLPLVRFMITELFSYIVVFFLFWCCHFWKHNEVWVQFIFIQFWVHSDLIDWLNNTRCVIYFTELILVVFVNSTVI